MAVPDQFTPVMRPLTWAWTDDFSNLTPWTFAFQVTATADTTVAMHGTQSVRLNPNAGTNATYRREFASPGLDLSNGQDTNLAYGFAAAWNIGVATDLTNVEIHVIDWAGKGGWWRLRFSGTPHLHRGWHISQEDRYSFHNEWPTIDWSQIRYISIRPFYTAGYTGPLWFDRIGFFELPTTKPRVLLNGDDGYLDFLEIAQYASERGVRFTNNQPTGFMTSGLPHLLNTAQVEEIIALPHCEVTNHATEDAGWSGFTVAQRLDKIMEAKGILDAMGARGDIYVAVGGSIIEGERDALYGAGITHIRGTQPIRRQYNVDPRLSSCSALDTYANWQTELDRAKATNGVASIAFHQPGTEGRPTVQQVKDFIDIVAPQQDAGQIETIHFSDLQLMGMQSPSPQALKRGVGDGTYAPPPQMLFLGAA